VFPFLVNKCRIYDEDSRARSNYYKSASDKRSKGQDRGKPCAALADKGEEKVADGYSQCRGGVRCY
jgi:hypothetical protein